MERQTVSVDISPRKGIVPQLRVSQGDIGRPLGVYIMQDGAALDCSGYTADLYVLKADGNYYVVHVTVDSTKNNLITWDTAEQETPVAGECAAQIRIMQGTDDIGTARFVEYVEASPGFSGAGSQSAIESLEEYVRQAAASAQTASDAADIATGAASTAAADAQTASNAATAAAGYASSAYDDAQTASGAAATAQAVLDSIPSDYSTMSADVTALKTAVTTKADAIYPTASGSIAIFPDGADGMPIKSLAISLEPVQSGSGDPSPDNVRPITGHSGTVKVTRAGINLCGGEQMADAIVSAVGDATKAYKGTDETGDYVAVVGNSAVSEKVFLKGCFKPNTQYTVIIKARKSNTSKASNLKFVYTDGTSGAINIYDSNVEANTVYTYRNTSNASKSIDHIETVYSSGTSYIYYDSFGVFEGVLTVDQFTPYQGQTYPITLPTSAGTVYGGTLDPVKWTLTVTHAIVDLSTLTWELRDNGLYRSNIISDAIAMYQYAPANAWAEKYKTVDYVSLANSPTTFGIAVGTVKRFYVGGGSGTITGNFVYELATPLEYTLTPTEIQTLLGYNAIWSDSGDVTVEYPADTKLYIDGQNVEDDMTANAPIASGIYFQVGNTLYKSTLAIAQGETIVPGTNCTRTTIAEALNLLAQ